MHHPGERNDSDILPSTHDRCLAKRNLVRFCGYWPVEREQFAMFEEDHRVVASQGVMQEPLCVVGCGRHRDSETRESGEQWIVVARVVSRGRMADADTTAEED